jgi:hypothetical protein
MMRRNGQTRRLPRHGVVSTAVDRRHRGKLAQPAGMSGD